MKTASRAPHLFVSALALLAAPFVASSAGEAQTTTLKPNEANGGMIVLPLEPVVPAAQRTCSAKTASGLGYTTLRPATGAKPAKEDTVLINYIGYLAATGEVFDQNMQSPMPVGEVIPGFSEGLQMLSKTGVLRLCIPAAMGYGAQAAGPIPANSDLVFQVELVDFKTPAEIEELRKAQQAGGASLQDQ